MMRTVPMMRTVVIESARVCLGSKRVHYPPDPAAADSAAVALLDVTVVVATFTEVVVAKTKAIAAMMMAGMPIARFCAISLLCFKNPKRQILTMTYNNFRVW
jgi:hypothetical protein